VSGTGSEPMTLHVTVQPQPRGAPVRGIALTRPLAREQAAALRALSLAHQVLAFPDPAIA